jgi:TPR repeat protein
MLKSMAFLQLRLLPVALALVRLALAQQPVPVQRGIEQNGMPSSGGYEPPSLSLMQLLESDPAMKEPMMAFMGAGDRGPYKAAFFKVAQEGDLAAEILLGEQYIPEQCTFEPNQDVPHCGKNGNEPPHVTFRANPLGIDASYEEASRWLQKASTQGSGEASEVLAQLITRMQANGHGTSHTAADSARFHALARSQGFDVEPLRVACYKLLPGDSGLRVSRLHTPGVGAQANEAITPQELALLNKAGLTGSLLETGTSGGADSVLLSRPEGATVHVHIILDHDPGSEVLLPIPAHHDEIYLQRGDTFLAFPSSSTVLPRFIALEAQTQATPQVSMFTQNIAGAYAGGFCAGFP